MIEEFQLIVHEWHDHVHCAATLNAVEIANNHYDIIVIDAAIKYQGQNL